MVIGQTFLVVFGGYWWLSDVFGGYKWLSVVIGGHRWLSVVIGGYESYVIGGFW